MTQKGTITAVCISESKGMRKTDIGQGMLLKQHGLEGDAHAGDWHRQVSLLSVSSINKMRERGLDVDKGDFAENLTVDGIDVWTLPVGTQFTIGKALLEVTQIGKECHTRCAIYYQAGDCVMPREGIFARVLEPGPVAVGDELVILDMGKGDGS
jgi:MOSC domain-containing protein YiiM